MINKTIGITMQVSYKHPDTRFSANAVWINNFRSIFEKYNIAPVFIPADITLADKYVDFLDGLIISGNAKHINPQMYGQKLSSQIPSSDICHDRTEFEIRIVRNFVDLDKPFFGICNGLQALNVALGGNLIQHIKSEVQQSLDHAQSDKKYHWCHEVDILPNTLLSSISSSKRAKVNTSHVQAIGKLGEGMVANCISTKDGVVEGAELPGKKFCLGVQWHPEFNVCPLDFELFENFCRAVQF